MWRYYADLFYGIVHINRGRMNLRATLGTGNKKLCEDILHEVAVRHHIGIVELSVMPDHIHVVVQLPSTMSVSKALQLLKRSIILRAF